MALITVFFPGPRKAIIDENHKGYFLGMGAVETQVEAESETIDFNPDKGFGRPGSLKWHILKINELKSKYAIWKYCREVAGKGCDRRLDFEGHKKHAIEIIKEHLENDKSS